MINKENGKIVDVIDTREKEEVVKWLKQFTKIKYITRDGSHTYGQAISEALPNAIQVSDRFHLFKGLTDYAAKEIRKLIPSIIKTDITSKKEIKLNKRWKNITKYEQTKIDNLEKRKILVRKVQQRYKECNNMNQICREMNLNKRTVGRYLKADIENMQIQNNASFSKLNKYKDFIYDNIDYPATKIYEALKEMGYNGAYSTVKNHINKIKRENKGYVIKYVSIKRTNILKLLFNKGINDLNVDSENKETIRKYLKTNKSISEILNIVTEFRIMMYSKSKDKLDKWLIETKKKNITEINKFINGVYNDYEAVLNCVLYLEQSNGIAEGKITKIKSIKRTMYGRCGFSYLRNKIFLID